MTEIDPTIADFGKTIANRYVVTANKVCAVAECPDPKAVRDWCGKHYQRWRKYGDPEYTQRPLWGAPVETRFFAKVDAAGVCWEWTGAADGDGYGHFEHKKAHRWCWEHLVAPIAAGLELDHLCRNPACVNPDHLEPVTPQVNTLRSGSLTAIHARKTHCPQGHPYSGANLRYGFRANGRRFRQCRACMRIRDAKKTARELETTP